jgi:6-pyruvoyltetrahydropterin/6-carboxytetrahydropterin synthase
LDEKQSIDQEKLNSRLWRRYETEFSAAHHIKDHPKCGRTHGHNYKVIFDIEYDLEFLDFHDIKTQLDYILKEFDHKDLGNMTAENLAKQIVDNFAESIFRKHERKLLKSIRLTLYETEKFAVALEKEF